MSSTESLRNGHFLIEKMVRAHATEMNRELADVRAAKLQSLGRTHSYCEQLVGAYDQKTRRQF